MAVFENICCKEALDWIQYNKIIFKKISQIIFHLTYNIWIVNTVGILQMERWIKESRACVFIIAAENLAVLL